MTSIAVITADQGMRLTEIGELTALAYLADGLVDNSHPFVPLLRDAKARAEHATLLMMASGDAGEGSAIGTITVVDAGTQFAEIAQDGECELRMLAVSPLARGQGVGKALARAAMDLAVERGARRVVLSTLETMDHAHGLYEKLGFARDESLDSEVVDGPRPLRLLGYAWTPTSTA